MIKIHVYLSNGVTWWTLPVLNVYGIMGLGKMPDVHVFVLWGFMAIVSVPDYNVLSLNYGLDCHCLISNTP